MEHDEPVPPVPEERVRLETVLAELDPAVRGAFERRIRYPNPAGQVKHFRHWVDNLLVEPRLSRSAWYAVVDEILQVHHRARIEKVFAASVRVFQRQLRNPSLSGPIANIPKHRILGKVIPRIALESYLRDRAPTGQMPVPGLRDQFMQAGFGGGRRAANRFVSALTRRDVFDIPDRLRNIKLHDHLMWSTFGKSLHPFGSLPTDRRTLRCVLGLLGDNSTLVKLVYNLPRELPPHVPTVVEAYAGGSWAVLFQPAHPGADCGQTIPQMKCGEQPTRPEVVHRPVTFGDLSARPELV